jgi:hypothetical protein
MTVRFIVGSHPDRQTQPPPWRGPSCPEPPLFWRFIFPQSGIFFSQAAARMGSPVKACVLLRKNKIRLRNVHQNLH